MEGGAGQNHLSGQTDSDPLTSMCRQDSHELGLAPFVSWLFFTGCVSLGKLVNLSGPVSSSII